MEPLLLVVVILFVLGLPAIVGLYAVWWNATSPSRDGTTPPPRDSVYRRGVEIAKTPAVLLFVPLALASIYIQLFVIGYGGGPPPLLVVAARVVGISLTIGIYVGGLTVAGTVLAVYIRTLLSEDAPDSR